MEALFRRVQQFVHRSPSPPRVFKSSNFALLDGASKIEEEKMPAYEKGLFYPVRIGEVLKARYKVLRKLGFGANSTVWFCRDLHQHRYTALKVYIHSSRASREVEVLKHLASIESQHPGKSLVRTMDDAFIVDGSIGNHHCLVHKPLLTSLLHLQASFSVKSLTEELLKSALHQIFLALDYLHSDAQVVHTDIQAKNIILDTTDKSIFTEWDKSEHEEPSPRKIDGDCIVYQSRNFRRKKGWSAWGPPILCDFGEARIGEQNEGIIQPDLYRAPEVILGMRWNSTVDIWNVGVMIWDLFEDHHMFDGRGPDKEHSDAHLLAEMIALLGPPPLAFLRRSKESQKYWDEAGTWKGLADVPENSLEDSEEYLADENKERFLRFMRKMLTWDPEERQSAKELLMDEWLNSPTSE